MWRIISTYLSGFFFLQISKDIKHSYEHFDGFVVLHGTDTLAYTASALSFMLENLGKPVIITGSQVWRMSRTKKSFGKY